MYSPRQIKTYKERFPTCEHPVNITYSDGTKGCWCPLGAYGDYDQKAKDYNFSSECFNCQHYKQRETPIKEMDRNTFEKYKYYFIGRLYAYLFE